MGKRSRATRLISAKRGKKISVLVDGRPATAYEGETVATVLLVAGQSTMRISTVQKGTRGIFCGIGNCFECRVTIDDVPGIRSCVTTVEEGMRIDTGDGQIQ